MKKYLLTAEPAERFTGTVVFGYSEGGTLIYYENTTNLTESQLAWWLHQAPINEAELEEMARRARCKLEALPEDLSFDAFWKKYNKKINKVRCIPLWNKMSDVKKQKCIKSIDAYKSYLLRTNFRGQLDPENYLKNQSWENNWNAEI